jgi:tetratricopeptide (TPR) repeat protein
MARENAFLDSAVAARRRICSCFRVVKGFPFGTAGGQSTILRIIVPGALIFCVTLLAYLPAVRGGFLWDDNAHVTRAELQSVDGLRRIWFEVTATQQYYPLLHTAFWVEHRLWGDAVVGYHLVNLLLHAAAACLVVAIMKRLALPGAWLAGFIFALHPVCVESVAWISEQKNTLSTVFYLASAFVYLGFDRDRRRSRYWWALGLFGLALLTKTVTATLPAALLVIFWWRRGRLTWNRDMRPLLPWLVLGVSGGLFTAWVERTIGGANLSLSGFERGLLAGRVIWFYLGKLAWPTDLMFIYPRWNVDAAAAWQYVFPLGVLALVLGLAGLAWKGRGPLARAAAAGLAGFLIFAGTLFPALGFFSVYPFIYSYVADHFQYLASVGLIVPLAAGLTLAARPLLDSRAPATRQLVPAGAGLLLATLGVLTWRQSSVYRNAETLYLTTLARNPACWMAHNNLGVTWSHMPGRLNDAIAQFKEALRLNPDDAEAHNNLGSAWLQMPGRLNDAIAQFKEAVRLQPNFAEAHNNLGDAWSKIPGGLDDAIFQYQEALRLQPNYAAAHNNLGSVWSEIPGRLNDAIAQYQAALRLQPDLAAAHFNLGNAWSEMPGRLNDAIAQYEAALRLQPDYAEAHNNLGLALSQVPGRLNDAIAQYEAALRLQPDFARAHNNLGLALSQLPGRLNDAIAQFEEVLRLQPNYAEAHNNLGLAWAQVPGRLNDAIAQFEAALRLQPDYAAAHNNLGLTWAELPDRLNDAIAEYKEALRLKPDFPGAHYNLGNAWSELPERLNDAIAQYEEALRLQPDYAEAHYNLGLAWSQVPGRLNDAITQFEAALRLMPDFAPGWHNLGVSLIHFGNLPAAAAAFREEVRLSPNDPAARQALAAALQQAGER